MSKIARQQYNAKYKMPDYKIMGTITPAIQKKLTDLVTTGDKSDIIEIIDSINLVLGTRISDISADIFPEPFSSKTQISNNYNEPTGVFFLTTSGDAELVIGDRRVKLQHGKITFVNERNMYSVDKQNNTRLIMLSGKFTWDPERHGT